MTSTTYIGDLQRLELVEEIMVKRYGMMKKLSHSKSLVRTFILTCAFGVILYRKGVKMVELYTQKSSKNLFISRARMEIWHYVNPWPEVYVSFGLFMMSGYEYIIESNMIEQNGASDDVTVRLSDHTGRRRFSIPSHM